MKTRLPLLVLMGGLTLILIGLLVALALRGQGASGSATSGPRLVVDPASLDFGRVPVGKPVRAAFKLRNVGDQPLQILEMPRVEVVDGC